MRLARASIRDFRNLQRVDLDVPPEGLALVGENGHGKTNLLEAIYYLHLLRSVRGARDVDLVRFGCAGFHVAIDGAGHDASVGFERASKKKRVKINGAEPAKLADALGALPSVFFSPQDTAIIAGAPSDRRRYMDVVLALSSRKYLMALQHYRGALVRRNAALREAARDGSRGDGAVAIWEPTLAEHGAVLWMERLSWIGEARGEFTRLVTAIGERGTPSLRYASSRPAVRDLAEARRNLAQSLEDKRGLDIKRGLTHSGPHRDDLEITLTGDDSIARDLRLFGSAGQQRTAAIALRLLEARTLHDRLGAPPLLLLDDPFAELDARRAERILVLLGESATQTILAVPREEDIPRSLTRLARLRIVNGMVEQDP